MIVFVCAQPIKMSDCFFFVRCAMSSGDSGAADASPRGPSVAEAAFNIHRPDVFEFSHIKDFVLGI